MDPPFTGAMAASLKRIAVIRVSVPGSLNVKSAYTSIENMVTRTWYLNCWLTLFEKLARVFRQTSLIGTDLVVLELFELQSTELLSTGFRFRGSLLRQFLDFKSFPTRCRHDSHKGMCQKVRLYNG